LAAFVGRHPATLSRGLDFQRVVSYSYSTVTIALKRVVFSYGMEWTNVQTDVRQLRLMPSQTHDQQGVSHDVVAVGSTENTGLENAGHAIRSL